MTDIDNVQTPADLSAFAELMDAFRELQQTLCVITPSEEASRAATAALTDVTAGLQAFKVRPHDDRPARELAMRGIGHPVFVPYRAHDTSTTTLIGSVTFTYAHMGGGGAVHGGVVTMLFDDLLGMFVGRRGLFGSRTAYLKVDFRSATPVHQDLRVEATIDRIEGRKTFVSGVLSHGDAVCAVAEALFVQPKA